MCNDGKEIQQMGNNKKALQMHRLLAEERVFVTDKFMTYQEYRFDLDICSDR